MDAYVGQIILFAGNYAPTNWAQCDGRSLTIQSYPALFALIGTTYGGDGRINFKLPDLRGRVPVGQGTGTDKAPVKLLTPRIVGQSFGTEGVILTEGAMPVHQHQLQVLNAPADSTKPLGRMLAKPVNTAAPTNADVMYFTTPTNPPPSSPPALVPLAADAAAATGGNQAHENRMPSLTLNYLICLNGLFPNRP